MSIRVLSLLLCALALTGLLWLGNSLRLSEVLERTELALLDLRQSLRAKTLTASDDIVIVAIDQATMKHARNHPELGINGPILPRRYLAQMIDTLHAQGAKAILMDLWFKTPQTPADDQALARAIQQAGNVQLASAVELSLPEFETRSRVNAERDLVPALAQYRLLPYLSQQAGLAKSYLPQGCATGYLRSGLAPVQGSPLSGLPDTLLEQAWAHQCSSPKASAPQLRNTLSSTTQEDVLSRLYRETCQDTLYQEQFHQQPGFLAQLAQHRLPDVQGGVPASYQFCATHPIREEILQAAHGIGVTSVEYEGDGYLRDVPLFYQGYQGGLYPYMGLTPALNGKPLRLGESGFSLGERFIPWTTPNRLLVSWRDPANLVDKLYRQAGLPLSPQERAIIDANRGNAPLNYGHLYRMVSAIDLLRASQPNPPAIETLRSLSLISGRPESGPLDFKDKIVIFGDTLTDIHQTPVGKVYGPEIVATVVDMMLHDRHFVQKAPTLWVGLFVLLMCAALIALQLKARRLVVGFGLGLAIILGWWLGSFELFIQGAVWLPLVQPSLAFFVCLMGGVVYRYYVQDREKRELTHVFSRYVSPQVMDRILEDPAKSLDNLAGAEKDLTVLFADLQGFTDRFNREDPQRMVRQLNEFFTAMTAIILKHEGTYDKYIGDAIMAFFGAPADLPDHAERACRAALEMQAELVRLNERWIAEGIEPLKLGIGLSSGPMIVGNFGSEHLKNFTVMGPAVNLGARLEALTRKVGHYILVSEETQRQASHAITFQDFGLQTIKGFEEPVPAFGVEALRGGTPADTLPPPQAGMPLEPTKPPMSESA